MKKRDFIKTLYYWDDGTCCDTLADLFDSEGGETMIPSEGELIGIYKLVEIKKVSRPRLVPLERGD